MSWETVLNIINADWPVFVLLGSILMLEGFFSGSEMALIAADKLALKRQAANGSTGAKIALRLLAHPEQLLATVLIGTNLCMLSQGALTTIYTHRRFGPEYNLGSIAILTPLILIVGELLPKTIFQRYATTLAPAVAIPVTVARWVFFPVIWVINRYTTWISRVLQPLEELATGRHRHTQRDILTYLLTHGRKETSLKSHESKLIHRILGFSRGEAKNSLIPLVNVDGISDTETVESALKAFSKTRHSRLPVYSERVDNIVGIVHVFDAFMEKDLKRSVRELMQTPFYIPETQKVDDLMFTMQQQGIQMGIVVDEYGGAIGILTLEDLIEEIVGDIADEYDADTTLFRELNEKQFVIQGRMEVEAINDKLKLGIPTGHYETLAGFLLQQFNRIPDEGDELYFKNLKFVVRQASSRMIKTVFVEIIEEA